MSEQTNEEETTAHDDVAAAFESVESEPAPDTSEVVEPPGAPPVQTELTGVPAGAPEIPDAGAVVVAEEIAAINAPQSWGVAEREGWNALDPTIQAQIDKREREISEALTHTGDSRQFQDQFNQAVAPYQQMIAAENSTPIETVGALLQTAASLMSGTPQTKAETAAQIIQQYGVDLPMLDSLLAGQMPENNPNTQFEQMLDQRLQPMQQYMQQQQTYQQQQYQSQYDNNQTEITQFFEQHEFAKDVSSEMGDLMQMAAQRNQSMNLDEAYEKAILLRPEIQQVIAQRQAGAAALESNQQVQQKYGATVSIPSTPPIPGEAPAPTSMREQIAAAMSNQG